MKREMTLFHTMGPNRNFLFQIHLLFVTIYGGVLLTRTPLYLVMIFSTIRNFPGKFVVPTNGTYYFSCNSAMTTDNGHLYVVQEKNSVKSKVCSAESGDDDYGRWQHFYFAFFKIEINFHSQVYNLDVQRSVPIKNERILGSRGLVDQATHYLSPKTFTVTARQWSCGKGNVFTGVCHSVHGGVCVCGRGEVSISGIRFLRVGFRYPRRGRYTGRGRYTQWYISY